VLEFAHVTRAYDAEQFSAQTYDDPDLLDAAARLEANAGFVTGLEADVR
jgi:hypothetical protein